MNEIKAFVKRFNAKLEIDERLVVKKRNRYYLLSKTLKHQISDKFFFAGTYLGAVKGDSFFPSFILLRMIATRKANKIVVDNKTAWLFICGRDIFKQGIVKATNLKKGHYALVLNKRNECLGFGKVTINIQQEIDLRRVALKNILDIGDFLRREKPKRSSRKRHNTNIQFGFA